MIGRKKRKPDAKIAAKARQALAFAETQAKRADDWVALHNALFGIAGKATQLFQTESERTAFSRTQEYKSILELMDSLPSPPTKEMAELTATANGAISVRVPRTVHAALLAEAKAEGISLNQLCLSKLLTQLRAVV